MVLFLEVPIAAVAFVLCFLSWRTMRKIKYLGVGKSFWIPILLSGIFFFSGSIVAILINLGVSFDYIVEFGVFIRLIGLCVLLGGVFVYSRRISKNLSEEFVLPVHPASLETEEEIGKSESVVDHLEEKKPAKELGCMHKLGYLSTLSRNTPIPDECLSCPNIIQCKHSYLRQAPSK